MSTSHSLSIISPEQLPEVAAIHARAFPGSALTKLGLEAVRRYYEWQLNGPHDHHFIGAFDADCLRAFAIGGKSRGALSGFVRQEKYFLASRMLLNPGVIFAEHGRKALRTAFRILTGRAGKANPGPVLNEGQKSFGVLAIAVDPACQRKGVGRMLMQELDRAAAASGYARMHLTVHPDNTKAVRFYEELGWTKSGDGFEWEGRMEKALDTRSSVPVYGARGPHG